jgi:hypothetical protein
MLAFHEEDGEMRMIKRWFDPAHGENPCDGDPYLESLARQLLLLRSGQTPRRPVNPRAVRGAR